MDIPFKIFDKDVNRYISVLEFVLISDNRFSLLPELLDVFQGETLLKFIDLFGGCTIKVPPRSYIDDSIRDVIIYMEYTTATNKKEAVDALSEKYNLTDKRIKQIVNKIGDMRNFRLEALNEREPETKG